VRPVRLLAWVFLVLSARQGRTPSATLLFGLACKQVIIVKASLSLSVSLLQSIKNNNAIEHIS